ALLENGVDRADPAIRKADEVVRTLAERSDQTYDLALAILFLARVQQATRGPNDALIRRLGERLADGEQEGRWSYQVPIDAGTGTRREPGTGSRRRPRRCVFNQGGNSNTQFALLGIWAAGRHGFEPNATLEAIGAHFRGTQNPGGGWGYYPGPGSTDAM